MRNSFKNLVINLGLNRRHLVALLLLISTIVVAFLLISKPVNPDNYDDDEGLEYLSSHANLINSEDLFNMLGGERQYAQLTEDIYVFGKKAYSPYRDNPGKIVGFSVNKRKVNNKDGTVFFEGKYGSSSNLIKISAKLLANERIQTSITDTKSKLSIDSELPSNSTTNKFVSTLPIYQQNYNIYYSKEEYTVRVDIGISSSTAKQEAIDYLISNTSQGFVNDTNVELYYLTTSPDGQGSEYLPTFISNEYVDY